MDSTWFLVVIGGITGVFVCWQAWETRKAAVATKDSVVANERHFRLVNQQWLEGRWSCRLRTNDDNIEFIAIHLDVVNPTPMSITFQEALHDISAWLPFGTSGIAHNFLNSNAVLPARRALPLGVGHYMLDTADKLAHYDNGQLRLTPSTLASYTDAFGQPRTQTLACIIYLRRGVEPVIQVTDAGIEHHPGEEPFFHPKHPNRMGWGLSNPKDTNNEANGSKG